MRRAPLRGHSGTLAHDTRVFPDKAGASPYLVLRAKGGRNRFCPPTVAG